MQELEIQSFSEDHLDSDRGYPVVLTDRREMNLLSSRFWPVRVFGRTFLRLYRSIP